MACSTEICRSNILSKIFQADPQPDHHDARLVSRTAIRVIAVVFTVRSSERYIYVYIRLRAKLIGFQITFEVMFKWNVNCSHTQVNCISLYCRFKPTARDFTHNSTFICNSRSCISRLLMMMITLNSRACKGGKERGDVKEEYRGMMMMVMIASTSRAHKGEKERGEVKGEYERMIMIAPNSRVREGRKESGGCEGGVWKNFGGRRR